MPRKPGKPRQPVMTPEKLSKLSRLYLRGMSTLELANVFGVAQNTIWHHLQAIKAEWKESQRGLLEEELAKVRELERVAWECFEESRQPLRKRVAKYGRKDVQRELRRKGASPETLELLERTVSKEMRLGSAAYLQVIQWCIEYRAKVMGYFRDAGASEMGDDAPVVQFVVVESREEVERFTTMQRLQSQMDSPN